MKEAVNITMMSCLPSQYAVVQSMPLLTRALHQQDQFSLMFACHYISNWIVPVTTDVLTACAGDVIQRTHLSRHTC